MEADLRRVEDADMQRVVQLLGKTNQFNLTTRRHSEDQVRAWLADPRRILLAVEQFLWAHVVQEARRLGFTRLRAEYLPTAKNAQVANLYDNFGLPRAEESAEGVVYEAPLHELEPPTNVLNFRG